MILGVPPSPSVLYNAINSFEEATCTKVIAGSIGGSVSLGLSNKSSDFDLYILYEKGETDWHVKVTVNSKESDCY